MKISKVMIEIIDRITNPKALENAVKRFREKGIILPTFHQQQNPEQIPDKIKVKLKDVGLWEINPVNLFRITWKNEPKEKGGLFGKVNYLELPKELTGVNARLILLLGKWFPTGAHKVGAAYGCLAPALSPVALTLQHKKQYGHQPATTAGRSLRFQVNGNRIGSILPEEMSRERFPGCATMLVPRLLQPPVASRTLRRYMISAGKFVEQNPITLFLTSSMSLAMPHGTIISQGKPLRRYLTSWAESQILPRTFRQPALQEPLPQATTCEP